MSELVNVINLRMGDWSDDGHGKTSILTIRTNLTADEINASYAAGMKIIGFDCIKDLCSEYEDNALSESHAKLLLASGFNPSENFETNQYGTYNIWTDRYPSVFLFFVLKGNPDFKYEVIEENKTIIEIGGYGLFS